MIGPRKAIRTLDISQVRFGNLVAEWPVGRKQRAAVWLCVCDCGNLVYASTAELRRKIGAKKRCLECAQRLPVTHGMSESPEYACYRDAKGRCSNPTHHAWKDYGARGIKFLFSSFEDFFAELGERPTPAHSVDRINNDGNYEPSNVRWATDSEQALNRRPKQRRTPCQPL